MIGHYTIGTGYCVRKPSHEDFFRLWMENTLRYSEPCKIHVLAQGSNPPETQESRVQVISVGGNPGHIHHLIDGSSHRSMTGWSIAVSTLAMLAYHEGLDFVFKEQDCLAFGNFVQRMYSEMAYKQAAVGYFSSPVLRAQSLFLVRCEFIPKFVGDFLSLGTEGRHMTTEMKFGLMADKEPHYYHTLRFGYDRLRPFNVDDEVFYLQQITVPEMDVLRSKGLV